MRGAGEAAAVPVEGRGGGGGISEAGEVELRQEALPC